MSIENEINVVLESNQRKYRLYAQYSTANSFSLQIISEDFTLRYAGEFTAAYIEEITVFLDFLFIYLVYLVYVFYK